MWLSDERAGVSSAAGRARISVSRRGRVLRSALDGRWRRLLMSRIPWICLLLTLMLLMLATSAAQLIPYDDFSSKRVDPGKWIGVPSSVSADGDADRREVSVGLVGQGASRALHI